MEERSQLFLFTDDTLEPELGIEEVEQKSYNIRSRIDAKVIVTGTPSGNRYEFPRAGSVVEVAEVDIEFLLAKRLGRKTSCCGGGNPDGNVMFELVTN